jgi:hypothetical protein
MKKFIFLLSILLVGSTYGMYHPERQGRKLKYTDITLTNKSPIPLKLSWTEITKEGLTQEIIKEILPGETAAVKLGEIGSYLDKPAKISYKPTNFDESKISDKLTAGFGGFSGFQKKPFTQEFMIDLPNSKAFAFTAVTMADIMKNIWVPVVFTADDEGNFDSFQYMNLHHPSQWQEVLKNIGSVKVIK